MILTLPQLMTILKANKSPADWLDPINTVLPAYKIDTPMRVAAFLSQCAHESLDFTLLQENLNYSAQGLLKIFPKYFNAATATQYARRPEGIANIVYANRMSNGNTASGDGYKYRGRGVIQTTGKANYTAYSMSAYKDDRCVINPDLLKQPLDALSSAAWFWNSRELNKLADLGDTRAITRRINGGEHGLADRLSRYNIALATLNG